MMDAITNAVLCIAIMVMIPAILALMAIQYRQDILEVTRRRLRCNAMSSATHARTAV